MKHKIIFQISFPFLFFFFAYNPIAACITIYSPEGKPVVVYFPFAGSEEQIAAWDLQTKNCINGRNFNAKQIGSSGKHYDCHSYAWINSEGSDIIYHIDGTYNSYGDEDVLDDSNYSNDGLPSYISCSEDSATHVYYYDPEEDYSEPDFPIVPYNVHSLRKIQNSYPVPIDSGRTYVSKWSWWGLVQHEKHHDPFAKDIYVDKFRKLKTEHSGTLTNYPKTWIGAGGITHNITGNVVVPLDVTLTIRAGAVILFEPGATLTVNGTLNVEGTSSNPITLTRSGSSGKWGGIKLVNGWAGATINHAVIEHAVYGIYDNSNGVDLRNSKIRNCDYGLSLNGCNGGEIDQNEIYNNRWKGVDFSNSLTRLRNNNIHHNGDGICCSWYSDIEEEDAAYNTIHHNGIGVYVETECEPSFNVNDIESNTNWNMVACDFSTVNAEVNWWGSNNPLVIESKLLVDEDSYIDYDPWEDSGLAKPVAGNMENSEKKTIPDLEKARELLKAKEYTKAQQICKEIIASDTDARILRYALGIYYTAGRRLEKDTEGKSRDEMVLYFKELDNKKNKKEVYGYAALLNSQYSEDKVNTLDGIIKSYGQYDRIVRYARYEKIKYYHIDTENAEMAKATLAVLEKDFPGSNVTFNAKRLLGDNTPRDPGKLFAGSNKSLSKEVVASIPDRYYLYHAYPNPFNPSTTIKYDLPFNSRVDLVIYNVRGQRIKSFSYSSVPAGAHSLKWEGTNSSGSHLPSGLYIIRFTAESLEDKPELFQKSMKVILLK